MRDHRTPTESLSFVHTARRSYRLGRTGELFGLRRSALREVPRACLSGGRRSRNKAAVGEPAAGSFPHSIVCHVVPTAAERTAVQQTVVDHWARASTKKVERSEIGGGEPQPYANRHFSNARGEPRVRCSGAASGRRVVWPRRVGASGPPCAGREDGPNLSISVSPGGESKGGFRSSGERKGRSRARGSCGCALRRGRAVWKGRRHTVIARWVLRACWCSSAA